MEADCLGPYPHESIYCYEHNCQTSRVEHNFRADIISVLNEPVSIDAYCLSGYSDDKEVGKSEAVEDLNFELESRHNDYSCIYGIA